MVSVEQAVRIVRNAVKELRPADVSLTKAIGHRLAAPFQARLDTPVFDQSAVDGFVILTGTSFTGQCVEFPVIGEIKAGDPVPIVNKKKVAYRIYTGAPVPRNAFAVIMQEHVTVSESMVSVPVDRLIHGANIRRKAGHFRKGEVLLEKYHLLSPASIGLLAAQGCKTVRVIPKPVVGVLVTGNELVKPGKPLRSGTVYESNSFSLMAALSDNGFDEVRASTSIDRESILNRKIASMLEACDVLILTGGISVGKYDLVYEGLKQAGVKELFYKVRQKPGKPLFVGKKGSKLIFALPGNPAAVMVCFYMYVLPALRQLSGHPDSEHTVSMPLASDFHYDSDRVLFLRAAVKNGQVNLLAGQESDNLLSFAHADALVYLSEGSHTLSKGENVPVLLLSNQK